jgi:hypothetical protein
MVSLCFAIACDRGEAAPDPPARAGESAPPDGAVPGPPAIALVEITREAALDFRHTAGSQDDYPMPAVMGGGAAVFDYDGDGDLDLYFVDYGESAAATSEAGRDRLFRQKEDGTFEDVTSAAGLGDAGRGMGCAVGDVDNDGDLDLFVTNWGPDSFWVNDGDGTFTDATRASNLGDDGFGTSATFLDYDRDGLLDLFVARYVDFDPAVRCAQEGGRRDYCGPTQFEAVHDLLYHNEGGGRFRDTSSESGIAALADAGLGVVAADFDDDGWIDVYVANDADPNHLWINRRDGRFAESAMVLGAALNEYGVAEAGMGVVANDVDADGDLDIFLTHLIDETNTLYRNLGAAGFEDATAASGLGPPSAPYTGFGNALADLDNDGDPDVAVTNGGVKRRPSIVSRPPAVSGDDPAVRGDVPAVRGDVPAVRGDVPAVRGDVPATRGDDAFWRPYAEPSLLFANLGGGVFAPLPLRGQAAPGPAGEWGHVAVGRGLVPFDLETDGDLDLLITAIDGPARLYRNDGGNAASWIQIRALDPSLRREALGARVTTRAGDREWVRHALPPGGYLTSGHTWIHLGLGDVQALDGFAVRWPDGTVENFPGTGARRIVELRRGEGDPR